MIAWIVFAIFIKLSCDGFMFPSFRNNDLLSYSAHEFAFKMNLINCIHDDYGVRSVQYQQWDGIVFCPLNFVFSPGVFSLFRLFVISSFRLASFRYFVFSHGVLSSFRLAFFSLFRLFRGIFSL